MSPRKILHSEKFGLLINSVWGSAKKAIGGLTAICVCMFAGFVMVWVLFIWVFVLMGEFERFFLKKCW